MLDRELVQLHRKVNDKTMDKIEELLEHPEYGETFRENFTNFIDVIRNKNTHVESYAHAVKYVTFVLAGYTQKDAYVKTFPERYRKHVANGVVEKDIASYITSYSKSKLVTDIMERAHIPFWLVNQEYRQRALQVQINIMENADVSAKTRSDAAKVVLDHLKPPETFKVEVGVTNSATSEVMLLRESLTALVKEQQRLIEHGVVEADVIAGTVVSVEQVDADD